LQLYFFVKVMVMIMSFVVVVEWQSYVGLEPFTYDANTISRALVLVRQQILRPEAKSVKILRV